MNPQFSYRVPVDQTGGGLSGKSVTTVTWKYGDQGADLLRLYERGKQQQWDASRRIDWSFELDPDNPLGLTDDSVPIAGSDLWRRLGERDRAEVRRNLQANNISQFLHGEQGALLASAKLVQSVPDLDSKLYAATQVMDEARHVEAFSRLLSKIGIAYPISGPLASLLEDVLTDERWDVTYLGMQVLIEGLALAAFQRLRDQAQNPLIARITGYIMVDEARHVAFGRSALRRHLPHLSESERSEREEIVIDGCYLMAERFSNREVWTALGLPTEECMELLKNSEQMRRFRTRLFSRIVPTVKDIGLWGPRIQKAFEELGAIEFAKLDIDALLEKDRQAVDIFEQDVVAPDQGSSQTK